MAVSWGEGEEGGGGGIIVKILLFLPLTGGNWINYFDWARNHRVNGMAFHANNLGGGWVVVGGRVERSEELIGWNSPDYISCEDRRGRDR